MKSHHNCEECPIRAKYDRNPKALMGRFWRWHIDFCPEWKSYMRAVDEKTRRAMEIGLSKALNKPVILL